MPTKTVKMEPVESAAFTHHGYDEAAQELHITFKNGDTWAYPVDSELHGKYVKAESKGGFFMKHIKSLGGRKLETAKQ